MASLVYSSGLTWINSLDGKKPGSPRIRRMIRSQAMSKAAAERKRKENHRNRKIRQYSWLTNPGKPTDRVLVLYAEAVKSLQAALDDPSQRMDQDVLGATEVLSIFELLDSERDGAWITHAAGAATLIQLRGPERWETCFEKALFLAQAGPIITEAMLKLSPCFLEEPAWQHLFRNVVLGKSPFSTYSDAFVKAWACISPVPGLFGSVRAGLKHPNELPEAAQARLLNRVLDLRARILKLGIEENLMSAFSCVTAESLQLLSEKGKSDPQLDLLGLYTTNLIRLERLIVALDSSAAMLAEARAQEMARQVLDLERTAISADSRAALSLRFKILIAKGTLSTWDEWRQEILRRPPNTMMDKNVFDHWALNICPSQSTRGIKSVST
ncbi:MAG: hypothetical protein LQ338_003403 [Usnochroma carphineum]|nr:MAG: hypothetical protein LQ338_003403 [Usnochroma carphineum]